MQKHDFNPKNKKKGGKDQKGTIGQQIVNKISVKNGVDPQENGTPKAGAKRQLKDELVEEINVELVPNSGDEQDIFNLIFKVDMAKVPSNVPKIGHLAGNCNQGRLILRQFKNF